MLAIINYEKLPELKANMKRVDINEFVKNQMLEQIEGADGKFLINIRGTNGTGKSTVPLTMVFSDPDVYCVSRNGKDILTVLPKFKTVALGKYYIKTGGCDSGELHEKTFAAALLKLLWESDWNILMEGMTVSSSFWWAGTFQERIDNQVKPREVLVMNLSMSAEKIEERIKIRNGGKDINMKTAMSKQGTVMRAAQKFRDAGFNSWDTTTADINLDEVLGWYADNIRKNWKGSSEVMLHGIE